MMNQKRSLMAEKSGRCDLTMPKFILEIEIENDAMETSRDISNALEDVSRKIRGDSLHYLKMMSPAKIRDIHGNIVGFFQVVETPAPCPIAPVVDAEKAQREQAQDSGYAHRFSLRDEK